MKYTDSANSSASVSGVIVVPTTTTSLAPSRQSASRQAPAITCANIPNGYKPLANAILAYVNAQGIRLNSSIRTDICGAFTAYPSSTTTSLLFSAAGYKDVVADINNFRTGVDVKYKIASTIPTTSSYEITSLKLKSDGSITFVVEDNATKKAIVGLNESAFSISENNVSKTFSSVKYFSSSSVNTDTVLTIDASGSMTSHVLDANGSAIIDSYGKTIDRRDLTALASYAYIEGLASNDNLAINIFDSTEYFYDDAYIDNMALQDGVGNVDLNYSANGFETDKKKSEFVIDIYNSNSSLFSTGKTAAFNYTGNFPTYGGGTDIYDALYTSIVKLNTLTTANNQYVVLMTDGANGTSSHDVNTTIAFANANNVVVNTISFVGANTAILEAIAQQTGGTFYEASGLNIADAFSAAQSAINYAYQGVYNTSTSSGNAVSITLTLNISGETISKTLSTTK